MSTPTITTKADRAREERIQNALAYKFREALRVVLSTQQGRLVVENVLRWSEVRVPVSYGNTTITHVEIGRREVGHHVLGAIDTLEDPATANLMQREFRDLIEGTRLEVEADLKAKRGSLLAPPGAGDDTESDWTQ